MTLKSAQVDSQQHDERQPEFRESTTRARGTTRKQAGSSNDATAPAWKTDSKEPAPPSEPSSGAKVAQIPLPADAEAAKAMAKLAIHPSANAAMVLADYAKDGSICDADVGALALAMSDQIEKVKAGDMGRAEAMLFAQAGSLQAMFTSLARQAVVQRQTRNMDTFLRLALKAQNQCRMTLETLSTIKNPPVVFAKQANINNGGQQQVNNGPAPRTSSSAAAAATPAPHAAKSKGDQTELLEEHHVQRVDARTQGSTSSVDSPVEAVGVLNRAQDGSGQGKVIPQRRQGRRVADGTGAGA